MMMIEWDNAKDKSYNSNGDVTIKKNAFEHGLTNIFLRFFFGLIILYWLRGETQRGRKRGRESGGGERKRRKRGKEWMSEKGEKERKKTERGGGEKKRRKKREEEKNDRKTERERDKKR